MSGRGISLKAGGPAFILTKIKLDRLARAWLCTVVNHLSIYSGCQVIDPKEKYI